MVWARPGCERGGRSDDAAGYRVREPVLRGVTPNARKQTTIPDKDAAKRPDLLRRDLASPVPTYRLVGDITYPDTLNGFIYLATAGDLATRMVVGWAIADNMSEASQGYGQTFLGIYAAFPTLPSYTSAASMRSKNSSTGCAGMR